MSRNLKLYSLLIAACLWTSNAFAGPMTPFPLSQTRLLDGDCRNAMLTNLRTLDDIGVERALYCFRFQAKLPTKDAKPLEGWASPEPGGAFPGFFEGHYLSAISLSYAQTGDPKLLERVNYMVAELGKCQAAMGGKYLFASPEEEFESTKLDGVVWYRMHKLMEGLLAAYNAAGNRQALEIAKNLADWIKTRQDLYTQKDQWKKVKSVEYGGMQEALENLFIATGNPMHKELSRQWEETEKLKSLHQGKDIVGGHANTELAKMVGAARTAEFEKDAFHLETCKNFWNFVAGEGQRCYATGGTSVHEGFPGARALANSQSRFAQETCCSYNFLKVTRSLFMLTGDLKYMDYFERSLFNVIMGSQDEKSGWKTYYQPLNANTVKDYRSYLTGCYCCNGTGLENFSKLGETIYSHDDSGIYVNLFIPSTVNWEEKKVKLEQVTAFPDVGMTHIEVHADAPVTMAISIRVPAWCTSGFEIQVNGDAEKVTARPGTYATLKRTWKEGDSIAVTMPMHFSTMAMPNKSTQVAFLYGPIVLVGAGATPYRGELVADPADANCWINKLDSSITPAGSDPLTFSFADAAGRRVTLRPYYKMGMDQFFTGYWDLSPKPTQVDEGNIALGKVTFDSTPNPSGCNVEAFMRSAKAVDGNYGGDDDWYVKWFPNGMAPQWITVDLGAPHAIERVEWFLAAEDVKDKKVYRYRIEQSDDNKTWKLYAERPDNKTFQPSYKDAKATTARYIRFTFLAQPELDGNNGRPKLAELKVFGKPVAAQ